MGFPRRGPTPNELLWFRQTRQRLDEDAADKLRAEVAARPLPGGFAEEFGDLVDKYTVPYRFCYLGAFTMYSDAGLVGILAWIRRNSKRPVVAPELFARMCSLVVKPDGTVNATRDQLAEMLDVTPRTVSEVISELVGQGYVIREQAGRRSVYRVNPRAASKAPPAKREPEQAKAPPLLTLMQGGVIDQE